MLSCVILHLTLLISYLFVRHSPLVRTSYLKALLHSIFLVLVSLEENQSILRHSMPSDFHHINLTNIPWVHNSIVYTQRFHYPNMKDRLTRRSISYHSNIVDGKKVDVMDEEKIALKKEDHAGQVDILPLNASHNLANVEQFTTSFPNNSHLNTKDKMGSKRGFDTEAYSLTNTLKKHELSYMNDVFNYYETFEDQTIYKDNSDRYMSSKFVTNSVDDKNERQKMKTLYYQLKEKDSVLKAVNSEKEKGLFDSLIDAFQKITLKNKRIKDKQTSPKLKQRYVIDPSKTASDRIGGPVITSHVVMTSIHPWIFPFAYMVAEPYMSFLVFIIITIVECLGIWIGYKIDFLGLRPREEPPKELVKASSATIIDLCASITCSVDGEKCVDGVCYCGSSTSCAGVTSGAYCDATNNVCKCSSTVAACSGTTDTCTSGACYCGTSGAACSISGETCQSGTCKCGTASSCSGVSSGAYCDSTNNVCKCSSTVDACSGTTDTCTSGACYCGTSGAACSNSGETCQSGTCMCGTAATCVGQSTGAVCDATNNVCKCSSTVAACSTGQECSGGSCVCK